MSRGSRFSTVLQWFREAAPDEVRAIMPLVIEACAQRKVVISVGAPRPVVKRHRRTKAELAADAARLNGKGNEPTAAATAAV